MDVDRQYTGNIVTELTSIVFMFYQKLNYHSSSIYKINTKIQTHTQEPRFIVIIVNCWYIAIIN